MTEKLASREEWQADAEGLAVKDGIATVGFERITASPNTRSIPTTCGPVARARFPGAAQRVADQSRV
jgi:hypothetical protein